MSFIICYTPYIYVIAIHALLNNKGVLQESGPIKFYRIGLRLIAKEDEWMTLKLSLVCQQKLQAEQGDQNGRIFAYLPIWRLFPFGLFFFNLQQWRKLLGHFFPRYTQVMY
jgi:hypothetical protein